MANKYITDEVFKKSISDVLQLVADNTYEFEPYDDETIASAFELSPDEQRSLSQVINDEYVAKNKVFSNEYTLELLEKTKAECNQYAVEQLANSGNLKRKIVNSDSEVIDENILYLILTDSTNNIYTQYMLIDGIATPLGNTQIDLSDYLLIDDFNITIADYAKKTEVVSQNDIVNDLTTVSSSTVLSSQGTVNELDKKIDKTSIVTSIDSTSTDEQVASAKAVYNNVIKDKLGNLTLDYTYKDSDSMNITLEHFGAYKFSSPTKGVPSYNVGDWVLINIPWGVSNNVTSMRYANQLLFSPRFEGFWHRTVWDYDSSAYTYAEGDYSVFRKWETVCTTSVTDIPQTALTYNDTTNYKPESSNIAYGYRVLNGICYLQAYVRVVSPSDSPITICNLPKPEQGVRGVASSWINNDSSVLGIKYGVYTEDSTLRIWDGESGQAYMIRDSYPVAES